MFINLRKLQQLNVKLNFIIFHLHRIERIVKFFVPRIVCILNVIILFIYYKTKASFYFIIHFNYEIKSSIEIGFPVKNFL